VNGVEGRLAAVVEAMAAVQGLLDPAPSGGTPPALPPALAAAAALEAARTARDHLAVLIALLAEEAAARGAGLAAMGLPAGD
jgi:hypothetical protein